MAPDNPLQWRPTASPATTRARAAMLSGIRRFFEDRGVLEVETPILSRGAATDPNLESFRTRYTGPGDGDLFAHTSPEFPMKRLLAAGYGDIYQICKVFRNGEAGRLHNPEFTMLEWYRCGYDLRRLMDELEELVRIVLAPNPPSAATEHLSYSEAFIRHAGVDPHRAGVNELKACAERCGVQTPVGLGDDREAWLDLLLTHVIEPALGRSRLTFLYEYPAAQASLARTYRREDGVAVAARFELYFEGRELANGFHELADANEQRQRIRSDLDRRHERGQAEVPVDARFLAAVEAGLPDCSGVAVGLDRLLMAHLRVESVQEVLLFPVDQA